MMLAQVAPPVDFFTLLSDASGPLLMAVIIWGAIKEWWVPGVTHRRTVQERDQLLKLAVRGTNVLDKTLSAAESVIPDE